MDFFKQNIIPGEVIVQLIAFLIVFTALKLMAWKPIQEALKARRDKIAKDLAAVEKARNEAEAIKNQYALHLQKIEEMTRSKVQEAVDEGRRIAREIQEKARSESQAAFDKAKENLELEIAKARLELRREIADLAVGASERILRGEMSAAMRQQAKVLEIIEELEKAR
jgi:F-type H+-transporting ATPase subunit b